MQNEPQVNADWLTTEVFSKVRSHTTDQITRASFIEILIRIAKMLYCQNVKEDVPKMMRDDDDDSEGSHEADHNENIPMVTVSSITKKQEVRLPLALNMFIDEILTKFYLKHRVMDRSSFREDKLNS